MIYWLVQHFVGDHTLFAGVVFRAVMAMVAGFLLVLLCGGKIIRWLMKQKIGDRPEFHNATLNELSKEKKNTPTMGGIIIIGSIIISSLLVADLTNFYLRAGLFCLVYLAVLGGFDDWLKLTTQRRTPGSRDGLFAYEKMLFQIGLGVLLAVFIYFHADKVTAAPGATAGQPVPQLQVASPGKPLEAAVIPPAAAVTPPRAAHMLNWPFMRDIPLPVWAFTLLAILVITGTSNAVNLTDGMDGLASGCMVIVAFAFMALSYVTGDFRWAQNVGLNFVPGTGELAVLCGAIAGACLGFLWYNCNPAQVFMGDTGSLALGGVIGYVAIVIRQEPMLLLIGGIFVVEALSVMMQVGYFRMTGGKRIFLCSPIHHHFHLKGWSEQQVVVRFWLICALCAAAGLATVKFR